MRRTGTLYIATRGGMGTVPPLPVPLVPWYQGYPPSPYLSVSTTANDGCRRRRRRRCPGLRRPVSSRVGWYSDIASAMLFVHVRSFEPGHQTGLRVIRSKCWIASRSDLARGGQARMAWPGHPSEPRPRGSEVYPSLPRDPGPGIPYSRIPAPNKLESILTLLTEPEEPGKVTFSGQKLDPGYTVIREIAGSGFGRIRAISGHSGDMCRKPAFPGIPAELIQRVG